MWLVQVWQLRCFELARCAQQLHLLGRVMCAQVLHLLGRTMCARVLHLPQPVACPFAWQLLRCPQPGWQLLASWQLPLRLVAQRQSRM